MRINGESMLNLEVKNEYSWGNMISQIQIDIDSLNFKFKILSI